MADDLRRVLHVGCGPKRLRDLPQPFHTGWTETRVDIDPACGPDIQASITDLSPVPDGSCDAVFSSHNIEHLYAHEAPAALAEFRRVLKPGSGFAVVTCPDLQALGKLISEGKLLEPVCSSPLGPISPLDILYGHRASIERGEHYMAHNTGFTARMLVDALGAAGFRTSLGIRSPRSLALWAIGFCWPATEAERLDYRHAYLPPN